MFSNDGFLTADKPVNQTHMFTSFPNSAVDPEEVHGENQSNNPAQSEQYALPLPATANDNKTTQYQVWQIEHYQKYFDVDTQQVLQRLLGSMMPRPNKSYFDSSIRHNPDLYGPFWVCVTFIVTVAISGNIVNYFHMPDADFQIDFSKITLSAIVSLRTTIFPILHFHAFLARLSLLVVNACIHLFLLSLAFQWY